MRAQIVLSLAILYILSIVSAQTSVGTSLLNIDFGSNSDMVSTKSGSAIVGNEGDFWNAPDSCSSSKTSFTNLKYSDGSNSGIGLKEDNLGGCWGFGSGVHDGMFENFNYPNSNRGGESSIDLTDIPKGTYDLYIYGHGSSDGNYEVLVNDKSLGNKVTESSDYAKAARHWEENIQYVLYKDIDLTDINTIHVLIRRSSTMFGDTHINGLQLLPSDQNTCRMNIGRTNFGESGKTDYCESGSCTPYQDFCIDNSTLIKYTCENAGILNITHTCDLGCNEGRCVGESATIISNSGTHGIKSGDLVQIGNEVSILKIVKNGSEYHLLAEIDSEQKCDVVQGENCRIQSKDGKGASIMAKVFYEDHISNEPIASIEVWQSEGIVPIYTENNETGEPISLPVNNLPHSTEVDYSQLNITAWIDEQVEAKLNETLNKRIDEILKTSCSEGCFDNTTCFAIGFRLNDTYCSASHSFVLQLGADSKCDNNFECQGNVCVSNKCISQGLLDKILNWFKNLF